MSKSHSKVMSIVFFDWQGIIHSEFVTCVSTVNAALYVNAMQRLREKVRRKRPEIWQNKLWMVDHDNTRSHSSLVREFLAKHRTPAIP